MSFSALGRSSPLTLETIHNVAKHLSNGSDAQASSIAWRVIQLISVSLYRSAAGILRSYRQLSLPNQ